MIYWIYITQAAITQLLSRQIIVCHMFKPTLDVFERHLKNEENYVWRTLATARVSLSYSAFRKEALAA